MSTEKQLVAAGGHYVPFAVGTVVEFFRGGAWQGAPKGRYLGAKVVEVLLDPNRKPGRGRVTYRVQSHPMYEPMRVAAKNVRLPVLEGGAS